MAAIQEALRRRAHGRCEYCGMPERFATLRFQQDHVAAQKHRGASTLENLAWACADCNAHKGSDLASLDPETGKLERLFNPRTDRWEDHFHWIGPALIGRTAVGRVTIMLLQMNRAERVSVRRALMAAGLYSL